MTKKEIRAALAKMQAKSPNEMQIWVVDWEDACSAYGWLDREEYKPMLIHSVGFVAYASLDAITLTTAIDPNWKVNDPLTIPMSRILHMAFVKSVRHQ